MSTSTLSPLRTALSRPPAPASLSGGGQGPIPPRIQTAVDSGFGDERVPTWYLRHLLDGTPIPKGVNARFRVGSREIVVEKGKLIQG